MEVYAVYFASLILFNAALAYHRHQKSKSEASKEETLALPQAEGREDARKFKIAYFSVYMLATGADWLQGPYMYTLLKDEKHLTEPLVAALFTTAFVSAGLTASFAGALADQHGRRKACLAFCFIHGLSCLSVLSNDILVLFAGRVLAGLGSTLLHSVFETWMIAEYHARGLRESLRLEDMFGMSATLSGVVAVVAGLLGEVVVGVTGTKVAPFLVGVVLPAAAGAVIWRCWSENYGEAEDEKPGTDLLKTNLLDNRILTLTLTTTIFEGSTYLFIFFWAPALKSARALPGLQDHPPPFGLIFSSFMSAMMLGSTLFSTFDPRTTRDTGKLLSFTIAMGANVLLLPVLLNIEAVTFWSFAVFEVCVGLYLPAMARLKSELVEEAVRGRVCALMRLPVSGFVVLALGFMRGGDVYRVRMFLAAGGLLLCTFFVVQRHLCR